MQVVAPTPLLTPRMPQAREMWEGARDELASALTFMRIDNFEPVKPLFDSASGLLAKRRASRPEGK